MEKKTLRLEMLRRRLLLSREERERAARRIEEQLFSSELYQKAETVYLYMDFEGEIPTGGILKRGLSDGKRMAVPVLRGGEMFFAAVRADTAFVPDRFGIMTPVPAEPVNDEHALMITPGVAFGKNGERLGHGGGYYDRYLKAHPGVYPAGICYDFQVLDGIPTEEHDVAVKTLFTANTQKEERPL